MKMLTLQHWPECTNNPCTCAEGPSVVMTHSTDIETFRALYGHLPECRESFVPEAKRWQEMSFFEQEAHLAEYYLRPAMESWYRGER